MEWQIVTTIITLVSFGIAIIKPMLKLNSSIVKLTDAVDCFNKVVSIDTDYTYAYYAVGLSYEYEHNNQKAIENYKKYVKLEHDQGLINAVNNKIKQLQK